MRIVAKQMNHLHQQISNVPMNVTNQYHASFGQGTQQGESGVQSTTVQHPALFDLEGTKQDE